MLTQRNNLFRLMCITVCFFGMLSLATAQPKIAQFKAAAVAYDPQWGDLDGNISRIAQAVNDVADQGVK